MSRFDPKGADEAAEKALAVDAETTRSRAETVGGAPAAKVSRPAPKARARRERSDAAVSAEGSAPMSFPIRLYLTVSEEDPLGKALADRVRSLPEEAQKHYSTNKAARDAILQSLEEIAAKI